MAQQKYMIIDLGKGAEETKLVLIAEGAVAAAEHGKILKAAGRNVIAPPVQGRSFSRLDKLALQYLYWHVVGKAPEENYGRLVQNLLFQLGLVAVDRTPVARLKEQVAALYPDGELAPPVAEKEAAKVAARVASGGTADGARPKATTTTGMVWALGDLAIAECGGFKGEETDWKCVRANLQAKCEAEGINGGTFAVQYSKWKKAIIEQGMV